MSHVGHARVYVTFDVVARFLRATGRKVTYVRNYTDGACNGNPGPFTFDNCIGGQSSGDSQLLNIWRIWWIRYGV